MRRERASAGPLALRDPWRGRGLPRTRGERIWLRDQMMYGDQQGFEGYTAVNPYQMAGLYQRGPSTGAYPATYPYPTPGWYGQGASIVPLPNTHYSYQNFRGYAAPQMPLPHGVMMRMMQRHAEQEAFQQHGLPQMQQGYHQPPSYPPTQSQGYPQQQPAYNNAFQQQPPPSYHLSQEGRRESYFQQRKNAYAQVHGSQQGQYSPPSQMAGNIMQPSQGNGQVHHSHESTQSQRQRRSRGQRPPTVPGW